MVRLVPFMSPSCLSQCAVAFARLSSCFQIMGSSTSRTRAMVSSGIPPNRLRSRVSLKRSRLRARSMGTSRSVKIPNCCRTFHGIGGRFELFPRAGRTRTPDLLKGTREMLLSACGLPGDQEVRRHDHRKTRFLIGRVFNLQLACNFLRDLKRQKRKLLSNIHDIRPHSKMKNA